MGGGGVDPGPGFASPVTRFTRSYALVGWLVVAAAALLSTRAVIPGLRAQEPGPGRPDVSLIASDFRYVPDRLEVRQDDLVRITIRSEDRAYSFAIDEYRIIRRVPAGGSTTFEFMAARPGTFRFYSNLTDDARHSDMQGELVVQPQ